MTQLASTLAASQGGGGVGEVMRVAYAHGHAIAAPLLDCLRRAMAAGWADQVSWLHGGCAYVCACVCVYVCVCARV